MSSFDNPAGRLRVLLTRLSEQNPDAAVVSAWAEVLGVEQSDVPLRLAAVGQLVPDLQTATEADAPAFIPIVTRFRPVWSGAIFPTDHALNSPLHNVLPDDLALDSLAGLDAYLQKVAPEGSVPEGDDLQGITDKLTGTLKDVKATDELPDELKHEIADRLGDVLRAIEHIDIGGPKAVQHAMGALVGGVFLGGVAEQKSEPLKKPIIRRIGTVALIVWAAFSSTADFQKNLNAAGDMAGELTAAAEKVIDGQGDHPTTKSGSHSSRPKKE